MKPIVKFHKYSLSFVNPPNARTPSSKIKGALIMINGGYGCIQPWPTLGDKNLEYHLDSILSETPSEIAQAAIKCCMIDSEARKNKFNLFESIKIPKHHLTLNHHEYDELNTSLLNQFTHIKLKSDNNYNSTIKIMNELMEFNFRIDFNNSLTPDQLIGFCDSLSRDLIERIDFIEDPFPYDQKLWNEYQDRTGINFALDRGPYNADKGFSVRVWKPLITPKVESNSPICITHNMDHELGRRYAIYCASVSKYCDDIHGTGEFNANNNGHGLGMDEYLKSLSWNDLV